MLFVLPPVGFGLFESEELVVVFVFPPLPPGPPELFSEFLVDGPCELPELVLDEAL